MSTATARTLVNPKTNASIETTLTNVEAAALCERIPDTNPRTRDFGRDMALRIRRDLPMSQAQMFWLHQLALDQIEREKPKEQSGPAWSFPTANIVSFLEPAIKHRKSGACVTFESNMPGQDMSNNGTVQIKRIVPNRAGRVSQFVGDYYVTDGGPYGANLLYGRITKEGDFVPHRDGDPVPPTGVLVLLDEFANDPVRFVQQYGLRTGKCCFCNHPLDDPNSVKLGYGPICAGHYNLPHGDKATKALEAGKPLGEQKKLPKGSVMASDLGWSAGEWPEGMSYQGLWYDRSDLEMDVDGDNDLQSVTYKARGADRRLTVFND